MPNSTAQLLRSRIGKVCVAITGATAAEMLERASLAVKETPFLEFRLDYLSKPAAALPEFKQFLAANNAATAIATCRRAENGGRYKGSAASELEILVEAANSGFQIVDLELESAEALKSAGIDKIRATSAGLIVSWHDFEKTPDLDKVYARIAPFEPDFVKIVPTAQCLTDNVKLMRFIERMSDEASIVGVCMGDSGIISRVLGVRAGSTFTFAAATVGEETAPGQILARTLLETYRIAEVDAATKVYGVAGDPVNKSLSPLMMNTAFRRETVNAVYLALQATDVTDLVKLIQEIPIQGVSITMPHKQSIMAHLAHTDPLSAKIGACNTVLRVPPSAGEPAKLYGFNTDVQGILIPLQKRIELKGAKALVLGAGGSARAAVFALRDKGAEVFILNRTLETAAKLAKQSGAKVIKREALLKSTFDVIINATPVGMSGQSVEPILTAAELKTTKLVFDLVYNPVDTPLLKQARSLGLSVITGVEMFVQQGARQFEIWTGKPAPEDEMLKVVIHALRQQYGGMVEPEAAPARVAEVEEVEEAVQPEPEPAAKPKVTTKAAVKKAPAKAAPAKAKR
ncbi:shikimate dehydrogenase [Granulicella tundricola]|uniref:Multifunctional fusion protein n=1 Tax=Granulicella tundricola (strain ATCC BAA-1859 / DSM 23138 / MP5ACTX9) TaxID=1198114 RepID=E8WWF5_GRATM|nr:shikimate dehydrogenase [Granulicella tundricola]ADW69619.1 shikimate 5-dehydrogenase [Granulicella tundricola MP5ACTX9]